MNVTIPESMSDEVTRLKLLETLQNADVTIHALGDQLNQEGHLKPHHVTDLTDAKKNRKAIRRILRYFSTEEQWMSYNID